MIPSVFIQFLSFLLVSCWASFTYLHYPFLSQNHWFSILDWKTLYTSNWWLVREKGASDNGIAVIFGYLPLHLHFIFPLLYFCPFFPTKRKLTKENWIIASLPSTPFLLYHLISLVLIFYPIAKEGIPCGISIKITLVTLSSIDVPGIQRAQLSLVLSTHSTSAESRAFNSYAYLLWLHYLSFFFPLFSLLLG